MTIEGGFPSPKGPEQNEVIQSPTPENIQAIARNLMSMKRFADRMPDVQKLITDITQWSRGENFDSADRINTYPDWTRKHFEEVVKLAGLK